MAASPSSSRKAALVLVLCFFGDANHAPALPLRNPKKMRVRNPLAAKIAMSAGDKLAAMRQAVSDALAMAQAATQAASWRHADGRQGQGQGASPPQQRSERCLHFNFLYTKFLAKGFVNIFVFSDVV